MTPFSTNYPMRPKANKRQQGSREQNVIKVGLKEAKSVGNNEASKLQDSSQEEPLDAEEEEIGIHFESNSRKTSPTETKKKSFFTLANNTSPTTDSVFDEIRKKNQEPGSLQQTGKQTEKSPKSNLQPQPKRKRGRPRKIDIPTIDFEDELGSTDEIDPPKKKQRKVASAKKYLQDFVSGDEINEDDEDYDEADVSSPEMAHLPKKKPKKAPTAKRYLKESNNGHVMREDDDDDGPPETAHPPKKKGRKAQSSKKFSKEHADGDETIENNYDDDDREEDVGSLETAQPPKKKQRKVQSSLKYSEDFANRVELDESDSNSDSKNENGNDNSKVSKKEPYKLIYSKDANGVKSKIFKCMICKKEATAKADLLKHIRVHTGERPYKCKICPASFVQITALRGHETIHTGQKNFACDVCGKKFAIKDRLRLHMRVHTGEKPHTCKICDITFARRSQVSQHMRIHDTTKNKFKCDECGAAFASYHTLKAHINSHLGIKEFQCCACGKKFLRVEGMYKHIRTVHRGNRPYTCNICGKAFKGHLQQHMRLHRGVRPYTCHLCDAAFTQNSQLTVHLRIHTGERPYKCQVCGSSFAHSSACKIHMRSHTGEKPFRCVLCSNQFAQLPHLKKHMKCVHGADKPYMCTLCNDFFKTQAEIDAHKRYRHNIAPTAEQEAQATMEDASLAKLRNRLAVLLYRISSEDRRTKFGFGNQIIDEVLKLSLESSGHTPVKDASLTTLEELRQNILQLLRWTIPHDTMEEYQKNNMTVDEVLDMLTS